MSRKHVTARVPEDLYEEIEKVRKEEKNDRSTTVNRLLERGVKEWKISNAVEKYRRGEASIGRAAELADVTVWEFTGILEERGVELSYSEEELEADIELALHDEVGERGGR